MLYEKPSSKVFVNTLNKKISLVIPEEDMLYCLNLLFPTKTTLKYPVWL